MSPNQAATLESVKQYYGKTLRHTDDLKTGACCVGESLPVYVRQALGRVDDDLIISCGGLRRRVRLASVLRRCTVQDAHLRGSELTIRFRPDPEVWPR